MLVDYNWAPPLSNFLPGIAGPWGIPLWVYYVNRGQGIASVGVRDKDGQILEFQSFNQACARVPTEGFRTFLQVDKAATYEPFRKQRRKGIEQRMTISGAEVVLTETNRPLGLEIEIAVFPLPNLPLAALARTVTIRNRKKKVRRVDWVDGVARILPFGLNHDRIKNIPRHIEAMMGVDTVRGVPLFRLKQTPEDSEKVGEITGGHFYMAPGTRLGDGLVVDPEVVFGEPSQYERAWVFDEHGVKGVEKRPQHPDNKTPCAFVTRSDRLAPSGELTSISLLGYVPHDDDLEPLAASLRKRDFLAGKRRENQEVIDGIGDIALTVSGHEQFDDYCRQNFVDNVMRGGMPKVWDTAAGKSAFYTYSRQNGDLERDYHFFVLEPTYLSQGTGHYRSVLQNRRCDAWFFPEVDDCNLRMFLNLTQLDGYNPLEVRGLSYVVEDVNAARHILKELGRVDLLEWLRSGFTPGELIMRLERDLALDESKRETVLAEILACSREREVGGLHEGFWVDHWHYNFDLLDIYETVWPDRLAEVLLERPRYTFFDDPDVIVPRAQRCIETEAGVRAYGSVVRDPDKTAAIAKRLALPYTVRTSMGPSTIYKTTLLVKLLTIVTNRLATLDPNGTGVEMEAGKPGWNDSMNGLPGLFGSGLSETLELHKAVRWLEHAIAEMRQPERTVRVFEELATFIDDLRDVIRHRVENLAGRAAFNYWDTANAIKERYRERTRLGVTGREVSRSLLHIQSFLQDAERLLDNIFKNQSLRSITNESGVPFTYFVNTVTRHRSGDDGTITPLTFEQRPVRLFLEGPVHWMKVRPEEALDVYGAVRKSKLYDKRLKMYKSCEDMTGESPELGRAVGAYPRGWIENESIYLHMEYKYLLEILRSGLCAQFWRDARTALVPFMDPSVYGRSTLEGASFIVSSAYEDKALHGRAFQPRLSGLTCEFIHMWILAVAGERPFRLNGQSQLELALQPRLPAWLFTDHPVERRGVRIERKQFAFKLLGHTLVVYDNPRSRDTFGTKGVQPVSYELRYRSGALHIEDQAVVPSPHAGAVRRGDVERIKVALG